MKYFFCFLLCLQTASAFTQKIVKGIIVEQGTNQPVPKASIFLNNTSIGTTASQQGTFELAVPAGKYDLIISSIGFETYNQTITTNDINSSLTIKLQPKIKDLETVVVEPFLKDGWEKWGRFFLENFIGTSAQANNCQIKNINVIKFRHSKKNNELSVYAMEPLRIENKALGYIVFYQLENFHYNFKTHRLFYAGYPFFQPMSGNDVKQKRWQKARREAYKGSMMHFMRSVFRNTLIEEGFSIKHLKKQPNMEKQRVKELYAKATHPINMGGSATIKVNKGIEGPVDSTEYYNKILRQSDYFDMVNATPLNGDSIAYGVTNTTAGMAFNDYLLIVYTKETAPVEYQKAHPDNGKGMVSQVTLINGEPLEILASGAYYDPSELLSIGYWAWSEKIAVMLPFDYKVDGK